MVSRLTNRYVHACVCVCVCCRYTPPFASCDSVQSEPDVFVDPVPSPVHLKPAAPQSTADTFRHASGRRRPLRQLYTRGVLSADQPVLAAFQPGSVIVYHRNVVSDGLYLNSTLALQGLESLVATTPDYWVVRCAGLHCAAFHSAALCLELCTVGSAAKMWRRRNITGEGGRGECTGGQPSGGRGEVVG